MIESTAGWAFHDALQSTYVSVLLAMAIIACFWAMVRVSRRVAVVERKALAVSRVTAAIARERARRASQAPRTDQEVLAEVEAELAESEAPTIPAPPMGEPSEWPPEYSGIRDARVQRHCIVPPAPGKAVGDV